MPTPDLYPLLLVALADRLDHEMRMSESVYYVSRIDWWVADPDCDVSQTHFYKRIATPVGPAAGPHTQLAHNLVLSWLGGGRFIELKTVQVDDELVMPRPCIYVPHIGYNGEWSQELRADPENQLLNQFEDVGSCRFHYHVTGESAAELAREPKTHGSDAAAFVSAMGSAGTIAAADRLATEFPDCTIVGVEPIQCLTLYNVDFGAHAMEGIGDTHVTWTHNVRNMDLLVCIDDQSYLEGLQPLREGRDVLHQELGRDTDFLDSLEGVFGVSGFCNTLGAIKTARHDGFGSGDRVFTVATDGFDRHPSVLRQLDGNSGPMSGDVAADMPWFNRNYAINPYLVEGKKTVAPELADQLGDSITDWVVLSVGDGYTIGGDVKGLEEACAVGLTPKVPRVLGVQPQGASPLVEAANSDEAWQPGPAETLADSISVGRARNPYKALYAVERVNGAWVAVSDESILAAIATTGVLSGVFAEPATAAATAGLQDARELGILKASESASIVVSRNGLKDTSAALRAVGAPLM